MTASSVGTSDFIVHFKTSINYDSLLSNIDGESVNINYLQFIYINPSRNEAVTELAVSNYLHERYHNDEGY